MFFMAQIKCKFISTLFLDNFTEEGVNLDIYKNMITVPSN